MKTFTTLLIAFFCITFLTSSCRKDDDSESGNTTSTNVMKYKGVSEKITDSKYSRVADDEIYFFIYGESIANIFQFRLRSTTGNLEKLPEGTFNLNTPANNVTFFGGSAGAQNDDEFTTGNLKITKEGAGYNITCSIQTAAGDGSANYSGTITEF